jgi:hypothetical protein
MNRLQQAILMLKKGKRPASDGIPPEILKALPEDSLCFLLQIFTSSITQGYIPTSWTQSEVIFLPKPNKTDYTDPRSFRPITLSSYILQVLERLVLFRLEETALHSFPLHPNQYGFTKGKSTTTAITHVLSSLETLRMAGTPTTAVFLDIKGVFDNVPFDKLTSILLDPARGIDPVRA